MVLASESVSTFHVLDCLLARARYKHELLRGTKDLSQIGLYLQKIKHRAYTILERILATAECISGD